MDNLIYYWRKEGEKLLPRIQIKKIVVCFLVFLLLTTHLNIAVFAEKVSYSKQGDASTELMKFLIEEYGDEQAPYMLDTIQKLGLVNESGDLLVHRILFNGKEYSLEEIQQLLADEQVDLNEWAEVDGQPIQLSALKKIIEIEETLGAVERAYENVPITGDHIGSLESLLLQASEDGISTTVQETEDDWPIVNEQSDNYDSPWTRNGNFYDAPNYYNDQNYITVEASPHIDIDKTSLSLRFSRSGSNLDEAVSFSFEIIGGSAQLQDPTRERVVRTVELSARQASSTVTINDADLLYRGNYPEKITTKEQFHSDWWESFSRTALIHIFDYKNLDQVYPIAGTDLKRRYSFYKHEYQGGAYLSFATPSKYVDSGVDENKTIPKAEEFGLYPSDELSIERVEAKSGEYKSGQLIPINITYDSIVLPKHAKEVASNQPAIRLQNNSFALPGFLSRAHSRTKEFGMTSVVGYNAVVERNMTLDDLHVQTVGGHGNPFHRDSPLEEGAVFDDVSWNQPFSNSPDITFIPTAYDALQAIRLDKDQYKIGETATVTVELDHTMGNSDWIIDGAVTAEDLSKRLKVSVVDFEQGLVDMDWKRGPDGDPLSPLVLEGQFEITEELRDLVAIRNGISKGGGKLRAKVYFNEGFYDKKNEEEGNDNFKQWTEQYANFIVEDVKRIRAVDLKIEYPTEWPSGKDYEVSLIDEESTKLSFTFPENATYNSPDQFEWVSSDEKIAEIDANGVIHPIQEGTVTFTLIAKNGGKPENAVSVTSREIKISATGSVSLVVPSSVNRVITNKGEHATIRWSTNVMSKYKEMAEQGAPPKDAPFTIELYKGNFTADNLSESDLLRSWKAEEHAELLNVTNFTIPGELLTTVSAQHHPAYTVRIRTPHPTNQSVELSAIAYIIVRPEATVAKIDKSIKQYITDQVQQVELKWSLENFERTNEADFEFTVMKNGELVPGSRITYDAASKQFSTTGVTEKGGSYVLNIDKVAQSDKIKDVYTLNMKAKNGPDSTWSSDSFYLQVYNSNALAIQIDGQPSDSHKLSNLERIRQMSSAELVALERNISLYSTMHMNYTDYTDIGEVADQFTWSSSDSTVGVINRNHGGNYSNIELLNFDSYQPKTNFLLTGIRDGKAKVTATHARTGMEKTVDVAVETLQDKLYLFQFYPKTKTTVTYTDKNGNEKTVESDENGELAIYDEDQIASDVHVTSVVDNTTYTGVINRQTLRSREQDPATKELYPINIFQLRQLSEPEIYFKTPDGKPYQGNATFRGGVYRNGKYSERTEITGITQPIGQDGKLLHKFDTTQFYSLAAGELDAADLSAKDDLEFVFEVSFEGDQYYPQLVKLNGNLSAEERVVFGDKVVTLRPVEEKGVFIASQTVTETKKRRSENLLHYTGRFGPSDRIPEVKVVTDFMWWGEQVDTDAYAMLFSELEEKTEGQSFQTFKYPFSNTVYTRVEQLINDKTIWLKKGESQPLHFKLFQGNGKLRKSFVSSAILTNMLGVEQIDMELLIEELDKIKEEFTSVDGSIVNPSKKDKVVADALKLFSNLSIHTDAMSMRIIPTDDPLKFQTVIALSKGNLPSIEGVDPNKPGDISFLNEPQFSYTPSPMDITKMLRGKYGESNDKKYDKPNKAPKYSIGGYYMGEISFNPSTEKWEHAVIAGGFNAGGGFEYTQSWNTVLPIGIPLTFSLTLGGGAEIDFKTSILYDELPDHPWDSADRLSVNDYLTSLRVIAYVEAFGGFGFDYTVVAAKIGIFGRITVENTSTWLNRDYLEKDWHKLKFGNKLSLEGIVGIRVVINVLFVKISHDIASLRYSHSYLMNNWKSIEEYWKNHAHTPLTAANADVAIAAYMEHTGVQDEYIFESQELEDRNYLDEYERVWKESTTSMLQRLDPINGAPSELQTNAYPNSNPKLADDGSVFVYLSDSNSHAIEDTVASWAIRSGDSYIDKGPINLDPALRGKGDVSLQVAGEGNHLAAVWVSQQEMLDKQPGEEVTNEEIMLMNDSTEIMVSIYNGSTWKTERLTTNYNPDLAPMVSVSNGKVFVAYRSVFTNNVNNPLDFTGGDSIVYTVYDLQTEEWSEVETLYNGTHGPVMGLAVDSMDDGTTAVVYTINDQSRSSSTNEEDMAGKNHEVIYSIVNTDSDGTSTGAKWKTKGIVKNLQLTNDQNAHDNPQLTHVRFPDGTKRFVIAWHRTTEENGLAEHDIQMQAIEKNGELYGEMIESLQQLQVHQNVRIHPNFTFVKMPKTLKEIGNLSILWKDTEVDFGETMTTTRDVIQAVRFGVHGDELYLSGALNVGQMRDFTEVDMVEAYVSDASGRQLKSLILGTTYTTDTQEVGIITPKNPEEEGDEIPVHISKTVSGMYTATANYTNQFLADEVLVNPDEIRSGYDLPIQIPIVNTGVDPIESLTLAVDGQEATFTNVSLLPNESETFTLFYTVPERIKNVPYQVTATFKNGQEVRFQQLLHLDIPDLGLSKPQLLTEEDGKRVYAVPIYNLKDAALSANNGKGRKVKLGVYTNAIFTEDHLVGDLMTITDTEALTLIDKGAYIHEVEVDVKAYLQSLGLQEIPDNGITLHLHAWAEESNGDSIVEFNTMNNSQPIWFERLSNKYNEEQMLLTIEQSNSETATTANITLQNMNMAASQSGNVVVDLLNHEGQVIESKYIAQNASQLLSFGPEQKQEEVVTFSQLGHSVQGRYFLESSDELNASLSTLTMSGIRVDFDSEKVDYALTAENKSSTYVVTTAANPSAQVTLLDATGKELQSNRGHLSYDLSLVGSTEGTVNEFTMRVQPASASGSPTDYRFAVTNKDTVQPQLKLVVAGKKQSNGTYADEVEVSVTPYQLNGFAIEKMMYRVNDEDWKEISYDGKSSKSLVKLATNGQYTITAKAVLATGMEVQLDAEIFTIADQVVQQDDVHLSTLEVVSNGQHLKLSPTFQKDHYNYEVQSSSNWVEVKAKAVHSKSKVLRKGSVLKDDNPVRIQLQSGRNVEQLIVEAEDGTKQMYELVFMFNQQSGGGGGSAGPSEPSKPIEPANPDEPSKPSPPQQPSYSDTKGHWAEEMIREAASLGIVNGFTDGTFKPNKSVTRAQFVTMLMQSIDPNLEMKGELPFTDRGHVGEWAHAAIAAAVEREITLGYEDGSFRPSEQITRAQMVAMIARATALKVEDGGKRHTFADEGHIPRWARDSIELLYKLGIVQGRSDNRFDPQATATRAEAAVMLLRKYKLENEKEVPSE